MKEKYTNIIKWVITCGIVIAGLTVLYGVAGSCVSVVNVKNSESVRINASRRLDHGGYDVHADGIDINQRNSLKPEKVSAVRNDTTTK